MEKNKYGKELDVAVKVVQMACSLCKTVQKGLISGSFNQVKSKNDDSPVTVAGIFIYFKWVCSDSCIFFFFSVVFVCSFPIFFIHWVNCIVYGDCVYFILV